MTRAQASADPAGLFVPPPLPARAGFGADPVLIMGAPGHVAPRDMAARLADMGANAGNLVFQHAVAGLLDELGVAPDAVARVLVGTGPGSYTGLRVGVATALGLARGTGAHLFGLPSLEARAWGALAPSRLCLW